MSPHAHTWLTLMVISVTGSQDCYWNRPCAYQLYSSKTPYDTVRGDIRDFPELEGCEAISIWSLNRHGNRNPGSTVTANIKNISLLQDQIIASYEGGTSQLCAQDIDALRQWSWNDTLEVSQSYLTGTGYEEIYDLAQRLRSRYPHLLRSEESSSYYFRPTNEQRTVTTAMAFTHGLSEGLGINMTVDGPWEEDKIIRPYATCERYQAEVRSDDSPVVAQIEAYQNTAVYAAVQNAVQNRLGISHQLSRDEVYYFYEMCRFYRSWSVTKQSPWCAVFSDEDLLVLEYRDDIRHYYRNSYGSWMNSRLGQPVLGDLYTTFAEAVDGSGRAVTAYFTHDTMLQMTFSAAGLFRDDFTLVGDHMVASRKFRTSHFAAFSTNLVAVLNRCGTDSPSYRVQFFLNEKETDLCPFSGCTWEEFESRFRDFASCELRFCDPEWVAEVNHGVVNASLICFVVLGLLVSRLL